MEKIITVHFNISSLDNLDNEAMISNNFVISTYNHWLNEYESDNNVLSFNTLNKTSENQINIFNNFEKKYLELFRNIYLSFKVYISIHDEIKSNEGFFNITSCDEFLFKCRNSIREKKFIRIIIPDNEILITGSYDLNHIVYYRDNKKTFFLKKIIQDSGLYILN